MALVKHANASIGLLISTKHMPLLFKALTYVLFMSNANRAQIVHLVCTIFDSQWERNSWSSWCLESILQDLLFIFVYSDDYSNLFLMQLLQTKSTRCWHTFDYTTTANKKAKASFQYYYTTLRNVNFKKMLKYK